MMTNCFTDTKQQTPFKTPWFTPDTNIETSLQHDQNLSGKKHTLKHLPLANPRSYHRSKLFTASTGINALLMAATTLFTYITHLRSATSYENVAELYQELQHEIKAFEAQAQISGYRSDIILIARYLLCAMLDETILTTTWGQQSKWHQHKLLLFFHNEDWGGERFFIILKRLCADPALHIDLLELAYICLSLGFTGQYQFLENNHIELEKTIEHVYQCIRWQRGDIKKELLVTEETKTASNKASLSTKNTEQPLSLWLLGSFTTTLIGTLYLGCNFLLGQAAAPLYNILLRTYG